MEWAAQVPVHPLLLLSSQLINPCITTTHTRTHTPLAPDGARLGHRHKGSSVSYKSHGVAHFTPFYPDSHCSFSFFPSWSGTSTGTSRSFLFLIISIRFCNPARQVLRKEFSSSFYKTQPGLVFLQLFSSSSSPLITLSLRKRNFQNLSRNDVANRHYSSRDQYSG